MAAYREIDVSYWKTVASALNGPAGDIFTSGLQEGRLEVSESILYSYIWVATLYRAGSEPLLIH
jgi:hypothetical protein